MKAHRPSFAEEKLLRAQGYRFIAGVDEVGRGALMGPVVAAAVILPESIKVKWRSRVRDSKQLRPDEREYLYGCIRGVAVSVGTGMSSNEVIDNIGIARATRLAMTEAVGKLTPGPEYLLIDFVKLTEVDLPQKGIIDGDRLVFSIASASIIAKVTRDHIVVEMDAEYPGYGFAVNKGYGTREHLECLRRNGPCPLHRRSFGPVKEMRTDNRDET
ncbi:MAG: ribonuclease HII [Chloroflexi bacterium RBG_16_58_8]|nr:MAG: ribonuclease HII [Chloroflexi bacterium RBG_16_58_8]